MPDEIYDIFDEQGRKIGTATWTECHTRGLLHRCASAFVFKDYSKEEMLIQKRSARMDQHPGLWTHAAGGHVLAGNSVEEGIQKELQEELFWNHPLPNLALTKIVTFFNNDMPNNREFLTLFETHYPGPFFYNPEEVAMPPQWIELSVLIDSMRVQPEKYTPAFHKLMEVYREPDAYATGAQF